MSEEAKSINKSAIKSFAIEARNILIKSATTEAGLYGISEDEIRTPIQKGPDFEVYETLAGTEKRIYRADMRRRENLVKAIQEKGFQEVIEETAYTWFNRLIAIRFMEVNDYLPTRTRVLSSETGNNTPDLINDFLDVDLGMTDEELQAVQTAKNENRYDDAFRLLFIKECNALNDILPGLFEKTDDYMELLLNMPYTSDGVVRMLIDTIPEKNFDVEKEGQIEIIGWLYQYYNTEPKAKAFAKKGKITKEEIPAVTQLFTPDWIVCYMVENSLGRLWLEGHYDKNLREQWKYYLDEVQQEPEVLKELDGIRKSLGKLIPEEIKVIDPCMGSGHILVYIFDVLMQIYREDGYTERDAAELILKNNLYGLDIDDRAYQLSYFAVLMKARQYNRNILKNSPDCNIYSIQDSNGIDTNLLKYFGAHLTLIEKNNAVNQIEGLIKAFMDAKEYGSIISVPKCDFKLLNDFIENDSVEGQLTFETIGLEKTKKKLKQLIKVAEIMNNKYSIVTTNPPYMGSDKMSAKLDAYSRKYYADCRYDLYAIMFDKCLTMLDVNGFCALITQHSWMYLQSYVDFRARISSKDIVNMAHLGAHAFEEIGGEVVQTTAFIMRNTNLPQYKAVYKRLNEITNANDKETKFLGNDNIFISCKAKFTDIPGGNIGYWVFPEMIDAFLNCKTISDIAHPRQGLASGNNNEFYRMWQEIDYTKFVPDAKNKEEVWDKGGKYVPVNKGGGFCKWYGNNFEVIKFDAINYNKLLLMGNHLPSRDKYFLPGVTWGKIASSGFSCRFAEEGFVFTDSGMKIVGPINQLKYICAFLHTKVAPLFLKVFSETIHFETGNIARLPLKEDEDHFKTVCDLVDENIRLSKEDWDSFETSWNFVKHPLCNGKEISIAYEEWKKLCEERFERVKHNEMRLNRAFVETYGLGETLDTDVKNEDVTIHLADKTREIKSFISYAVGCMFGRYSIDFPGIAFAGGNWDINKYKRFSIDKDAIIPITDEEYLGDDIVTKFVEFIKIVYGATYLEENLEFIANALKSKGSTSREVIRNYFLNEFYKDHCNTYSVTGSGKRPIYWLFDSGKQNGFKALIYIHRYNPDTVGLIRSTYLHKVQAAIENSLQNTEYVISTSSSATEKAAASRKRDKYVKQLNELRPYYQALSHVALQRIDMDLDDGVKANYQLFQGVEISTEGKKKQKIDLLAKI